MVAFVSSAIYSPLPLFSRFFEFASSLPQEKGRPQMSPFFLSNLRIYTQLMHLFV